MNSWFVHLWWWPCPSGSPWEISGSHWAGLLYASSWLIVILGLHDKYCGTIKFSESKSFLHSLCPYFFFSSFFFATFLTLTFQLSSLFTLHLLARQENKEFISCLFFSLPEWTGIRTIHLYHSTVCTGTETVPGCSRWACGMWGVCDEYPTYLTSNYKGLLILLPRRQIEIYNGWCMSSQHTTVHKPLGLGSV